MALFRVLFPNGEIRMATLPLLALCAALVLCPTTTLIPWLHSSYDEKRVLQLLALLGTGVALAVCARLAEGCRDVWLTLPRQARFGVSLLFLIGVVSSLVAPSPRFGLLETTHYGLLFSTILVIASAYSDARDRFESGLSIALAVSVGLYLVAFASAYLAARLAGDALSPALLLPGFSNMRFLSQVQTWTLPLLALPLLAGVWQGRGQRAAGRLLLAGWWFIALVAEGRGTLIGVSLALGFCGIAFRGAARPLLREQLLAVLVGLALYGLLIVVPTTLSADVAVTAQAGQEAAALNNRGELWRRAATMTMEHPWLGVGPLHYAYYRNPIGAHPHNALLQWTAEWGIPATVITVSLIFWGFWRWLRLSKALSNDSSRSHPRQTAIVVTAAVLAGAVHSMVSGVIVMPLSQLLLVVVAGLMLGFYQGEHSRRREPGRPAWRARLIGGTLAATVASFVLPDLAFTLGGQVELMGGVLADNGPRFWMSGDFPR